MNDEFELRKIKKEDNAEMANIIRSSLEEFKANKPGTVYFDDTTDHLFEVFRQERSSYFIVEQNNVVVGGAGVFPTKGLPKDTCELVKLYVSHAVRGKGVGKLLMKRCLERAAELGYKTVYLESMPELKLAIPMYEKWGFAYIDAPLGESGHTDCDVWMIKSLP